MSIRSEVIVRIQTDLSGRFRVIDNTGDDKKLVSGQFPDILLYGKETAINDTLLFIMKVENGGELVDSVPLWKSLSGTPTGFYIVVQKDKLNEAKKLAAVTGVKARFAWYEKANDKLVVHYE
ncbi:MAG: hypothetical protein PHZ00_02095 [Candidatus Peribacteraceae bacterium]|nr:hypothetical protein [Candidatus Peribacteraceae bacterium]